MPVDVVEMKGKFVGALRAEWPWAHSGLGNWCACLAGMGARTGCGSDLRAWVSELQVRCTFRSFVLSSFRLVTFPVAKGGCPRLSHRCAPSEHRREGSGENGEAGLSPVGPLAAELVTLSFRLRTFFGPTRTVQGCASAFGWQFACVLLCFCSAGERQEGRGEAQR